MNYDHFLGGASVCRGMEVEDGTAALDTIDYETGQNGTWSFSCSGNHLGILGSRFTIKTPLQPGKRRASFIRRSVAWRKSIIHKSWDQF